MNDINKSLKDNRILIVMILLFAVVIYCVGNKKNVEVRITEWFTFKAYASILE